MATTAHEVSLGVSVETAAGVSSLEALQQKIRDIGATFSGAVSQLNGFTGALSQLSSSLSSVSAGALVNWSTSIQAINSSATAANSGINSFSTALNTLSTAVNATDLSNFRLQLAALQGTAATMAAVAGQITPFTTAIKALGAGLRSIDRADIGVSLATQIASLQAAAPAMSSLNGTITQFGAAVSAIGSGLASISGGGRRAAQFEAVVNSLLPALTALSGATVPAPSVIFGVRYALNHLGAAFTALSSSGIRLGSITGFATALDRLVNGMAVLGTSTPPPISVITQYQSAVTQLLATFSTISSSGITSSQSTVFARAIASIVTALNGMGAGPNLASVSAFSTAIRSLATSLASIPASSVATLNSISGALTSMSRSATSLRSIPSVISNVNSSLSEGDSGSKITSTAGAVGLLTSRLTGLVGAYFGAQAIRQFGSSVMNTGADFDQAMGMVKAVSRNASDYTAEAFSNMEQEAIRMGRTTTYTASQAAEALKELTQGGLNTSQAISALSETMKLAETEQMSVATASGMVTSMLAQFQAGAGDLSTFVDKLAKVSGVAKPSVTQLSYALSYVGAAAKGANQSFDETIAALGALGNAGVEASKGGTTLRDMLSDLVDTNSFASKMLRGLGISTKDINPQFNSLSSIIGKLRDRGISASDAMTIFGVRGGLAAGSLISVYDQYMMILDAVKNKSQGAAEQMQKDVTSNLRADLKRLSASWEDFVISVFKSGFGNFLRGIVQQAKVAVQYASDFVQMFKNAGDWGYLKDGIEVATELAFGKGVNILMGGMVSAGELLVKSMGVLADTRFWSFLFDIGKILGLLLESAAFSLATRLIEGGRSFVVDITAGLLDAADFFISKITAGFKIATSPLEYTKLSSAKDVAQKDLEAQKTAAQADLGSANPKFPKSTWDATIKASKQQLDLAQMALDTFLGTIEGNSKANRAQAEGIVASMSNDLNDVAANFKTTADESMKALIASGRNLLEDALVQIKDSANEFSPLKVIDTSKVESEWEMLVKKFFPKELPAPPKDKSKVTGNAAPVEGVGNIARPGGHKTPAELVADSMQQIGGGGMLFGFKSQAATQGTGDGKGGGATTTQNPPIKDVNERIADYTRETAMNTKRIADSYEMATTAKLQSPTNMSTPNISGDSVQSSQTNSLLNDIKTLLTVISTRNIVVNTNPLKVATM